MFRMIPCVITARDPDGVVQHVANTMSYRGAKRLKAKLEHFKPARAFTINELWNHPMLKPVSRR